VRISGTYATSPWRHQATNRGTNSWNAAREGDFEALVAVLDPDVVLRADGGEQRPRATIVARGAEAVAARALTYAHLSPYVRPALVNGAAGVVVAPHGRPFSVMGFTVADGKIVAN
jgi:hypothetical protein